MMQDQILSLLNDKIYVRTSDIADYLGVSTSTTRRHLNKLEKLGLVKRTHGGVVPTLYPDADLPIQLRTKDNSNEKELIGQAAAAMVQEDDVVFLGSGSTTLAVAKHLVGRKNITVITNSLAILKTLEYEKDIELICLGGVLRHSEESFIGYLAETSMQSLRPAKAIIGIFAVSLTQGLTNENLSEISTDRVLFHSAPDVILVADHNKFGKTATTVVAPITSVNKIVTDSGIDQKTVDQLTNLGIEVTVVS